jgi:dihydropteroate synthase
MGIVNVTPDSFSDGGRFIRADAAVAHALALAGEGADILDIGGESTRPGAEPVAVEEELRRVLPVIEGIVEASASLPTRPQISIDTSKAEVAAAALGAGASLVNDVSAFRADPEMAAVVAGADADCCLMHMLGEPRTMQDDPRYGDVVDEVREFLGERLAFALDAGVQRERIMLDPGIGFGKTERHNLELLRRLEELVALGRPVVIGTSRKGFLGRIVEWGGERGGRGGARRLALRRRRPPIGWRARSRRTCSRSSAGRACSACTTWPRCARRSRWRLLRWRDDGRRAAGRGPGRRRRARR